MNRRARPPHPHLNPTREGRPAPTNGWIVNPIEVRRLKWPGVPGWEQVKFRCFHKRPGHWVGEPAAMDHVEALARINPCKLNACPDRV